MAMKKKQRRRLVKARASVKSRNKMKTKRAANKRFKVLGSGKVKVPCGNKQHNTGPKTRARKNRLRRGKIVSATKRRLIERCLPYSF
jgi:large subunit ribosomal protein L35